MSKMIIKACVWNKDNQRHMKILEWATSQTKNFSNYLRDLVVIDYEKNHSRTFGTKPNLDNDEKNFMKKLV